MSHNTVIASPLLSPRSSETENNSSTSYYDGYPQRTELENYSLYLLGHLRGSRALSTTNLALWNRHFDGREEACEAVDAYVKQMTSTDSNGGCRASYRCDYEQFRFPATIIVVDCDSTIGYCQTTQKNWPVRGSCLGDQYYLTTLKFLPDTVQIAPAETGNDGTVETSNHEGSGEPSLTTDSNVEDIKGRWAFQTTLQNKGCLCLSK